MRADEPASVTRILLVEDEAIIALDLRQRLEDLGYVVTGIAVNGADALALAETTSPTLVFMDITIMGPMDGIETAKVLTSRMDVPVVFLTAHTDAGTVSRAKAAKPYGYLVKPFDERELATTIEVAVYRHRTEAEARLLQQAIGSANVGIVIATTHEPQLPLSLSNAAFQRMTGFTEAEALGKSAWFLEGKDTDQRASAEIRKAIQEQRDCQVTLLAYRKDGTTFWDDLALSAVRNKVGEVTHFLFFHTDVSARRHAEIALFQSQKVEAIGQLAGGVAHDFNNILAVITGYCEMAQRQIEPAHPARPRLDQILKAATRAAALTRQLLAFSRKQVLQPRPLDLNAIVADAHKMLGRLIGENISVVLKPAPGLGTVNADPGQIEQIVLNLSVNARDAMPRGGTLTLETRNVDLDEGYAMSHPATVAGRYVMLAVSDTGIGMTPEVQAKAFDPFFTTKPEGQGTGLGLATVYGIVKQSGGNVWVYSEPGHGTTFRVYLPRVDRPNANLPVRAAARNGDHPPRRRHRIVARGHPGDPAGEGVPGPRCRRWPRGAGHGARVRRADRSSPYRRGHAERGRGGTRGCPFRISTGTACGVYVRVHRRGALAARRPRGGHCAHREAVHERHAGVAGAGGSRPEESGDALNLGTTLVWGVQERRVIHAAQR